MDGKSLQCDRVLIALQPPALPLSAAITPKVQLSQPLKLHHYYDRCDRSFSHGLCSLSRHCSGNHQSTLPIPSAFFHSISKPSVTACRPTIHRAFRRVISSSPQPFQQWTTWRWRRVWRWQHWDWAPGCKPVRDKSANTVGLRGDAGILAPAACRRGTLAGSRAQEWLCSVRIGLKDGRSVLAGKGQRGLLASCLSLSCLLISSCFLLFIHHCVLSLFFKTAYAFLLWGLLAMPKPYACRYMYLTIPGLVIRISSISEAFDCLEISFVKDLRSSLSPKSGIHLSVDPRHLCGTMACLTGLGECVPFA